MNENKFTQAEFLSYTNIKCNGKSILILYFICHTNIKHVDLTISEKCKSVDIHLMNNDKYSESMRLLHITLLVCSYKSVCIKKRYIVWVYQFEKLNLAIIVSIFYSLIFFNIYTSNLFIISKTKETEYAQTTRSSSFVITQILLLHQTYNFCVHKI